MIKIPKTLTLNEIEALFGNASGEAGRELMIPTNVHCGQLGGIGALAQYLVTWTKRHQDPSLLLHTGSAELIERYLENLARTHHGLIAMLLSVDILTGNRRRSVLPEAFKIYDAALRKMATEQYDDLSGPEILLLCADDTDQAFIPQLYANVARINDHVRGQREFVDLADRLIRDLSKRYSWSIAPKEEIRDALGTILYELFKNTHQWARYELNGEEIARSVRGIRFELNTVTQLDIKRQPARTQAYVRSAQEKKGTVYFLEITIFDSGPGLAARGLEHTIDEKTTLTEEYSGVLKCLKKYSTSSDKDERGIGLLEVMRTLTDADAFLRIRTGRLALARSFISDPLVNDGDLWLYDWFTESDMLHEAHSAEGLLLSMLIPLEMQKRRQ